MSNKVASRPLYFRYEKIEDSTRYHVLVDEEVLGSISHDAIRKLKMNLDVDGTGWLIDENNKIWYKQLQGAVEHFSPVEF